MNLVEHIDIVLEGDLDWHDGAQAYLKRLGAGEYEAGVRAHVKRGRRKSTYRHRPSEYHDDLIVFLGKNDEQGFKALKGLRGYASDLGV